MGILDREDVLLRVRRGLNEYVVVAVLVIPVGKVVTEAVAVLNALYVGETDDDRDRDKTDQRTHLEHAHGKQQHA